MVKPKGHSQSQIYNNHDKTSTDIPSGFEFVAEQIEHAQRAAKRLERHTEIMSGKSVGDLSNMPKSKQNMWFDFGYKYGSSDKYKKQNPYYNLTDTQFDKFVRKGISSEYVGRNPSTFFLGKNTSYGRERIIESKGKKQKRIS